VLLCFFIIGNIHLSLLFMRCEGISLMQHIMSFMYIYNYINPVYLVKDHRINMHYPK